MDAFSAPVASEARAASSAKGTAANFERPRTCPSTATSTHSSGLPLTAETQLASSGTRKWPAFTCTFPEGTVWHF
jgi:hypothetical protein